MKSIKELLPKVRNNDSLVLAMIKELLGQGSNINITINNYLMKKLQSKECKETKDEGQSVLESPPSVKAENFIKK